MSYCPVGEYTVTSSSGNDSCFLTVIPRRLTSSGTVAWASDTRFCTSTFDISRSEPTSKEIVRFMRPSLELTDFMYSMFSTPLTFCSSGVATDCSTTSALAPV